MGLKDRFCVRECYLPLMLSYLRPELLQMVHHGPLASVAVSRECYSVGYSPLGSWSSLPLDANYRRVRRTGGFGWGAALLAALMVTQ